MPASRVVGLILPTTTEGGLCTDLLEPDIPHVLALRLQAQPELTDDDAWTGTHDSSPNRSESPEIGIMAGPDEAPTVLARRHRFRWAMADAGRRARFALDC